MENIDTNNNWDWRIYCNNKKCDFSVELKIENLETFLTKNLVKKFLIRQKNMISIFFRIYTMKLCGKCIK